ncbi:MAG: hypothetical protein JW969_18850 [Spirochaetales bacterium]|nr:hypothetical protein [Spirochaetales bacterium]
MKSNMPEWVKDAIFYQVYPQSFYDANNDGIGDIPGITAKLDYLKSMGFNAIWINPCFESPFQDAGYDISDFYKVAPRYGTNDNLRELFREAKKKHIRVCLDLVAGHTSVEHPWFKQSSKPKPNQYSNYYIWTDNAWESGVSQDKNSVNTVSGFAERNGNFVSNFFYFQPALNYGFAKPDPKKSWQLPVDHEDVKAVREEMKNIIRFWLNMGASGFRVDMASSLVKGDTHFDATINFWREVREMIDADYPETILISEWGDPEISVQAGFHIDFFLHFGKHGDAYLSLCRKGDLSFFHPDGKGDITYFLDDFIRQFHKVKEFAYIGLPSGNHDMKRMHSDIPYKNVELALAFILTMPGIPFMYYGDEIGMKYIPHLLSKEGAYDRTGSRTPMHWEAGKNMGFSKAREKDIYLPVDYSRDAPNVKTQEKNPDSLLSRVKKIIQLRKNHPSLGTQGQFSPLFAEYKKYPLIYLRSDRDEKFLIAINPSRQKTESTLRFTKLKKIAETLINTGCHLKFDKKNIRISLDGQSYGIFRMD